MVQEMTCSKTQLLIDEIGSLDRLPPEAARHVAACQRCERFGDELLQLRALLRAPDRIPAPADFDASLARRLRAVRAERPRRSVWTWIGVPSHGLATAAALVLVAFSSVAVWRSAYSTEPAPRGTSAPVEIAQANPPTSVVVPPAPVDSPKETTVKVSQPQSNAMSRPGNRRVQIVREAPTSDAMILVSDEAGTRMVSVPTVLVGSESAVPASIAAAPSTSDASVAF